MTNKKCDQDDPADCTRKPKGVEVTVPSRDLLSNPEKFDDIRKSPDLKGSTSHLERSMEDLLLT